MPCLGRSLPLPLSSEAGPPEVSGLSCTQETPVPKPPRDGNLHLVMFSSPLTTAKAMGQEPGEEPT